MEIRTGRFFPPRGVQQDDGPASHNSVGGDRRSEESKGQNDLLNAGSAAGSATLLARIRAMLGGASLETSPTSASESFASEAPGNTPRDKSTEDRPTEREAAQNAKLRRLRKENDDLRRQLAESQGTVRALKEELGARTKSGPGFAKPYKNVSDQDHEKVLGFIEKHGMDPAEDYDRTLTGLAATDDIKIRRT